MGAAAARTIATLNVIGPAIGEVGAVENYTAVPGAAAGSSAP